MGKDEIEPGKYVEMKGFFDFVDLEYLEGLFSKDGIIELLKKNEKEQARRIVTEHEDNNMNRDQRRHEGGKLVEKKIHECEKQCDKKYEGIHGIVAAMKSIIPFRKMLVSDDGYLIPVEDKFFRVNPETFRFMYGGEIKCVGMITNIIGEATDLDDESNIFATIQFSVNKLLRSILPTKEGNMYIVSPIAIYYES